MTKQALRQTFLAHRKALSAEEVEVRSEQIGQRLFEQKWIKREATVHTFLPILRQNEVNTWPIIHRLWRDFPRTRIVVPVTDIKAYQLNHYELTPKTRLVENQWGIPEPLAERSSRVDSEEIDLVLIPLLIFDQQGQRVGYGGGFYDRFLAQCRSDCLKIGLSLFAPVETIKDVIPTDIRLDIGLTPERVYLFNKI